LASEHDVTLVARKPHVEAIRKEGLRLTGHTERVVDVDASMSAEGLDEADVVFVTVKAYQTEQAVRDARPVIAENTFVVSLQNGLGNVETVAKHTHPSRTVGATTSHGCIFHGPGRVEHAGTGDTVLGPPSPPRQPAHDELAAALTDVGIETRVVDDVRPELWAKAAVNAAINPTTAITGLNNGALRDIEELDELVADAASEVEAVARAEGIDVEDGEWGDKARTVADRTADNRSSMLQDVQSGNRTEIDAICGHVAKRARELGVEAPVNRTLARLVRGIEATLYYDG
jgi:2-dehydropantoate 2-reductase